MASLQLQQWSLTLSGYDYVIHYNSDNEEVHEDAFSWPASSQYPDNVSVSCEIEPNLDEDYATVTHW